MSILEDYIKMSLLAGHNNIRNLTVHQAAGGFARINKEEPQSLCGMQ
jgi:hypothetical protein